MHRILPAFLLIILSVGTCFSQSNFFPLAVGNSWAYRGYLLDSNGVKIPGTEKTEYDTIVGRDSIGGRLAYVMHTAAGDSALAPVYYSLDGKGNLWTYEVSDLDSTSGYWTIYAALSDTTKGETDTFFIPAFLGEMKVTDTVFQTYHDEIAATLPAGSFTAREYSYSAGMSFTDSLFSGGVAFSGKLYYARGVGKVKGTAFIKLNTSLFKENGGVYLELVSYSIK